ncbi:MAG: ATP-dependent helicase [Treponema sp.]|nr:ATP-dependent helicase [Treponema sp.]
MNEEMQKYLDVLNPEQKDAVIHEGNPLLILAGAGSGKTRVITTKIAYLINEKQVNPYSILSVTFTKKAANEMKERAIAMEPRAEKAQIRTFHSFGTWFLRKYAEEAGLESSFTVYDDDDMVQLIKKACPSLSKKEVNVAAHQISLCKDYCLMPDDDLSEIGSELPLNEIYRDYQKRLRATGNTDFGDLIMLPVKILQSNPVIASEVRGRFQVIMVDEYQDSNIAQYKFLQELSGVQQGSGNYVCVVGDDDQSIYKFRGAEVQNIISFPDKFPGTDIIRLERNYRSTAKILNAASIVVNKNSNRLGKTLVAERGDGGQPVLAFLGDANAEATFCGDLIRQSVTSPKKPAKYSDWAILYRTNAQSLSFEKEFLHRKIPYVVVGSLKFYEREEIKDALAYLSLCANPKDEISFRRIINKPSRGLGEKTQDKIMESAVAYETDTETGEEVLTYSNLIEAVEKAVPTLPKKAAEGAKEFSTIFKTVLENFNPEKNLSDFIQRVVQDSGLLEYHTASDEIEGTQRAENLQELANSAVPYKCTLEGLLEFLDAINLDRTLDVENENAPDDAVTLITIHNTKGLEFNRVIITGLEEGVFPRMGKTGAELEEERRLFYVGITRAKDELYITSAQKRNMYGSWQFMNPSPFIKESSECFKVIGQAPFGFNTRKVYTGPAFGKQADELLKGGRGTGLKTGSVLGGFESTGTDGQWGDKAEVAEKWPKGKKVFSDDYGYGMIVSARINEGEYVIEVQFENGSRKKFLPEYQRNALTKLGDD